MEGNLRFKIDWVGLIVGSKFTVFALFYFVFEGNFPSTSPRGAYIWRGDLTEGFLRYRFGGLIHEGAYFPNFSVLSRWTVIYTMDSAIHLLNRGQKLTFLHWESIFFGNLPGCALHALLLQYLYTPFSHFKNVFSASSAASLSIFPFIQHPIFCFHREVWGIKVCQIFYR